MIFASSYCKQLLYITYGEVCQAASGFRDLCFENDLSVMLVFIGSKPVKLLTRFIQ